MIIMVSLHGVFIDLRSICQHEQENRSSIPYENFTYEFACEDTFSQVKCANSIKEIVISHVK